MIGNKIENSLRFVGENLIYEGQDDSPLIFDVKNTMIKGADEIKRLETENAALRERLKKVVSNRCIYYIASIWNDATMQR